MVHPASYLTKRILCLLDERSFRSENKKESLPNIENLPRSWRDRNKIYALLSRQSKLYRWWWNLSDNVSRPCCSLTIDWCHASKCGPNLVDLPRFLKIFLQSRYSLFVWHNMVKSQWWVLVRRSQSHSWQCAQFYVLSILPLSRRIWRESMLRRMSMAPEQGPVHSRVNQSGTTTV